MPTETRWLIERHTDGMLVWFCPKIGRDCGAGNYGGWTVDANEALSFARKVDAQEFINNFLPMYATADLKAADHGFS